MKLSVMILALGLLMGACGGGGPGDTPEATFEALKSAVANHDFGGMFDMMAESTKEQMKPMFDALKAAPEAQQKAMCEGMGIDAGSLDGMSFRDFFIMRGEKAAEEEEDDFENMKDAEIIETKIDGEKATIKYKAGGETDTMKFILVDGKWVIDS